MSECQCPDYETGTSRDRRTGSPRPRERARQRYAPPARRSRPSCGQGRRRGARRRGRPRRDAHRARGHRLRPAYPGRRRPACFRDPARIRLDALFPGLDLVLSQAHRSLRLPAHVVMHAMRRIGHGADYRQSRARVEVVERRAEQEPGSRGEVVLRAFARLSSSRPGSPTPVHLATSSRRRRWR